MLLFYTRQTFQNCNTCFSYIPRYISIYGCLHVPWWSVCNQDQHWVKQSRALFKSWSRDQNDWDSERQKSTDQKCTATIWPLHHWKSSNQELLKGMIEWSRPLFANLDPSCKCFNRWHVTIVFLNYGPSTFEMLANEQSDIKESILFTSSTFWLSLLPARSNY